MRDMIWWDAESFNGKGARSEYASEEPNLGPENKMPIPCGGCENQSYCTTNATDCQAFREWSEKGKYQEIDSKGRETIGLRLKAI